MMRMLKKEAPRLAEHDVKVMVVSPSEGPEADDFARALGLDYQVLVDPDNQFAQYFGAIEPKAFKGKDAPLPASFLIDPEGVVRWASLPTDVTQYAEPREALLALEAPRTAMA